MITQILCDQIQHALPQILAGRAHLNLKDDNSYVSEGDLIVQSIAVEWAKHYFPEHCLISEEMSSSSTSWDPHGSYIVIDPIDGTENFISGLREWGVGVSIYTNGTHQESCIFLPELGERQITGMPWQRHKSRIVGLSSSLNAEDLKRLPWQQGVEFRIIGCAMYNLLMVARGSFMAFENVKGVNCWDILPGLNLALAAGCKAWVDDEPYIGQLLFPVKKYRVKIICGE